MTTFAKNDTMILKTFERMNTERNFVNLSENGYEKELGEEEQYETRLR